MKRNYLSAVALITMSLLAIGSVEAPPEAKKVGSPRNAVGEGATEVEVEVLDVKLVPFKLASNGKMGQEILTTWKNKGDKPVRVVYAEFTAYYEDGTICEQIEYTLFATFDDRPGVRPGAIHRTKPGEGYKLTGYEGFPGFRPAASATVRITKAADKSGM
jgi:hypothetical protein